MHWQEELGIVDIRHQHNPLDMHSKPHMNMCVVRY